MDSPIVWVIVAVVVVALLVATWFIAIAYRKNIVETKIGRAESQAREIIDEAQKTAEAKKREILLEAKEDSLMTRAVPLPQCPSPACHRSVPDTIPFRTGGIFLSLL